MVFQERRACLGAVVPLTQSHRGSRLPLSVPPSPPLSPSFQPPSPPALPFQSFARIHPCHFNPLPPPCILSFTGCFPSSPSSRCTLQMHQPRVSGCFLFHVRVIPTGPQPNESFPLRYGEKITFRVWSEQPMQHEAHMPCPLCGGARHSLYTRVHATAHTRTQTDTERWLMLCASCCILHFTGSYFGSVRPQT